MDEKFIKANAKILLELSVNCVHLDLSFNSLGDTGFEILFK